MTRENLFLLANFILECFLLACMNEEDNKPDTTKGQLYKDSHSLISIFKTKYDCSFPAMARELLRSGAEKIDPALAEAAKSEQGEA